MEQQRQDHKNLSKHHRTIKAQDHKIGQDGQNPLKKEKGRSMFMPAFACTSSARDKYGSHVGTSLCSIVADIAEVSSARRVLDKSACSIASNYTIYTSHGTDPILRNTKGTRLNADEDASACRYANRELHC